MSSESGASVATSTSTPVRARGPRESSSHQEAGEERQRQQGPNDELEWPQVVRRRIARDAPCDEHRPENEWRDRNPREQFPFFVGRRGQPRGGDARHRCGDREYREVEEEFEDRHGISRPGEKG